MRSSFASVRFPRARLLPSRESSIAGSISCTGKKSRILSARAGFWGFRSKLASADRWILSQENDADSVVFEPSDRSKRRSNSVPESSSPANLHRRFVLSRPGNRNAPTTYCSRKPGRTNSKPPPSGPQRTTLECTVMVSRPPSPLVSTICNVTRMIVPGSQRSSVHM
jgi:hypothetical protein